MHTGGGILAQRKPDVGAAYHHSSPVKVPMSSQLEQQLCLLRQINIVMSRSYVPLWAEHRFAAFECSIWSMCGSSCHPPKTKRRKVHDKPDVSLSCLDHSFVAVAFPSLVMHCRVLSRCSSWSRIVAGVLTIHPGSVTQLFVSILPALEPACARPTTRQTAG